MQVSQYCYLPFYPGIKRRLDSNPRPQDQSPRAQPMFYLNLSTVVDWVVTYLKQQKVAKAKTWVQCYKTFQGRNLRIFVISQSVCPLQALPAQCHVFNQGQSLPKRSARKMLHCKTGCWPYPQTLDQAVNTCQGKTLQLMINIRKLPN